MIKRPRFTEYGLYKFDKVIFRITAGIIIGLALFMVLLYGYNPHIYLTCPEDTIGYCRNPLYNNYECELCAEVCPTNQELCSIELLPPGFKWGNPPSILYLNAFAIFAVILMLSFLLNHYLHNARYAH